MRDPDIAADFRATIRQRAEREPAFRRALLREATERILSGDANAGQSLIRNYISRIETEEENEQALAMIEPLIVKGDDKRTADEDQLLELLTVLVERFEERAYPMPQRQS